jgi:organic hydroperoxide reductase OsmC/OhrA
MTGTLAVALAARKIPTHPDKISSEVEGIIENVDGHPLITKIVVRYTLRVPAGKKAEAERAIAIHEKGCPASQSVQRGIAIAYSGTVEEE